MTTRTHLQVTGKEFNGFPIILVGLSDDVRVMGKEMSFRGVLLRGSIDEMAYQPYLVMTSRLNSTLKTTEEYRTLNEINTSAIFLHRFVKAASYDWVAALMLKCFLRAFATTCFSMEVMSDALMF